MKVTDPQGAQWTIGRRWLPRYEGRGLRERWRQRSKRRANKAGRDDTRWYDFIDLPSDIPVDSFAGFVIALAVLAVIIVAVVFGLPLMLALFDALVVLVMGAVGIVGRVLFRRPWSIDAQSTSGEHRSIDVVGFRDGRRAIASLSEAISSGSSSPDR